MRNITPRMNRSSPPDSAPGRPPPVTASTSALTSPNVCALVVGLVAVADRTCVRILFVKVHRTVSPAFTTNVAVAEVTLPVPPVVQSMAVRRHPVEGLSFAVYVPGETSRDAVSPSRRLPDTSPVKVNRCGTPLGIVCFSITIVAVVMPVWPTGIDVGCG